MREAEAVRSVHFEAWCLEALAEAMDLDVQVPLGPHPVADERQPLARVQDLSRRAAGA